MKEKVLTFINDHFYLLLAAVLLAVGIFITWLFFPSGPSINAPVLRNNAEAREMTNIALDAKAEAIEAGTTRRIEDDVRDKTIKPKLDAARKTSESSRISHEKTKKAYETEQSNTQNLNTSRADNCARLAKLFPDVSFADCQ